MHQISMYLSVIIPTYNEEKRLSSILKDINEYLIKQKYSYEILVVDDGSIDKTKEIAENLIPEIKNLQIIGYEKNKGKGFAVRFGMMAAKGEYRVFTDADNSTNINHLEKMLPEFEKGIDIVIGSRDVQGAILDPPQPFLRRLLGTIFRLVRKIIVGIWDIEDTQCGFKIFSAKTIENIFPKCRINRWAFDPEILIIAKKCGYKIKEIPVYWKNDPNSKVKFKGMVNMLIELFKISWNSFCGKYDKN